ncbi:MAG: prepilin peptidase [Rickettsiales bacterium]|nr:prepilin peptidase [Rickettsiales bacterium]
MLSLQIILYIFSAACACAMAAIDWRIRIIPDALLFPFMLAGLALGELTGGLPWVDGGMPESIIAACIGYALGAVLNIAFKLKNKKKKGESKKTNSDPIGMGDIKLLGAGGIWLGVTGLSIAVASACLIGIAWGLCARQKYVPFAPFFFIGAIAAIIAGTIL